MQNFKDSFRLLLFFVFISSLTTSFAQMKVGENALSIHPSALLEMESTSQGLLLPRLTILQRDSQTNWATGSVIYNTIDSCFQFFDGNIWDCMVGAASVQEQIDSILNAPGPLISGFGGGVLPGGTVALCPGCAIQTADGGYILALSINFGWQGIAEGFEYNGGAGDMLVLKLDADLNISWRKQFASINRDKPVFITQTLDGGYLIGASNNDALPYSYLTGLGSLIDPNVRVDGFILRLDSMGNQLWVNKVPDFSARAAVVSGIELKDGSGFLISIFLSSTLERDLVYFDMNGNLTGSFNDGGINLFAGGFRPTNWGYLGLGSTNSIPGGAVVGINNDLSIRFTKALPVYTGVTMHPLYLAPNGDDFYLMGSDSQGSSTLKVVKGNSSGNIIWSKTYNTAEAIFRAGSGYPIGHPDSAGNLVMVGEITSGTILSGTTQKLDGPRLWPVRLDGSNGDILDIGDRPYGSEFIVVDGQTSHILPFQGNGSLGINFASASQLAFFLGLPAGVTGNMWLFTLDSDMNLEENQIIFEVD